MKRPEDTRRELADQWLEKAESDYRLAEYLVRQNIFYEAVGFHCQQAAEKYLKALLVHYKVDFPKTHILGALLDLVAEVDVDLAQKLSEITILNPYGVEARYPGDQFGLTEKEARAALDLATKARKAILNSLDDMLK